MCSRCISYAERRGLQRVGGKSSSHFFFERLVFPGVSLPSLPVLPPAASGREESLLRRTPDVLPLRYVWPPLHHSALDHWIKCEFSFYVSKLSSCPMLFIFLSLLVCTSFLTWPVVVWGEFYSWSYVPVSLPLIKIEACEICIL